MGCCGGSDPGIEARRAELERQLAIRSGTSQINKVFEGFTPSFYKARGDAYRSFAMPQLSSQQRGATKALSFALARQGLLRSSAAEQASRDLDQQAGLSLQQIEDQATAQESQLRRDVEGERGNLLTQLHATGDPNLASQRAIATAANLRLPSTFAPIGQLFSDLTNQYTNRQLAGIWNSTASGPTSSWRSTSSPMPRTPSRVI